MQMTQSHSAHRHPQSMARLPPQLHSCLDAEKEGPAAAMVAVAAMEGLEGGQERGF